MRAVAVVLLVLFLAGCTATGPASGANGSGTPSTASATATLARTNRELVSSTGAAAPTGTSFNATIPTGGATSVTWVLDVRGANALGTISFEGDGCAKKTSDPANQVGGIHLEGTCGDLVAGKHSFTVTSSQGGGAFTVTVHGDVTT
jgi:hypothetical protein